MKENHSAHLLDGEKKFLFLAAAAAAVSVGLAFWFAVPLWPEKADGAPRASTLMEAARVDLNHADTAALCTLPGVGESRAREIVAYRVAHGGFASVDEAAEVEGITQETVDSWAGLAYIG